MTGLGVQYDNETYSSPRRKNMELRRNDKLINTDYYKELKEISDKAMAQMYENNHNNWTGD